MTTSTCWQPPVPTVARLGFRCGWLILEPTFLNFGLPSVLVDHLLVGAVDLQLEPFATHDPSEPWREGNAYFRYITGTLSLWQSRPDQLIARGFHPAGSADLSSQNRIILLVGDTYDVQLSWSALWDCRIGACDLLRL